MTSEIGPGISKIEQRALVERICASRHFTKAPRLRDFLIHITDRSLENRAAEITESEIAREVFERGAGFAPQEDSVVRSAARQLRLKLKEYFDDEGRQELWRIEVPKGSYVPVFIPQSISVEPVLPPSGTGLSRWLWISLAGNAFLAAVCAFLFWHFSSRPVSTGSAEPSVISAFLENTTGTVPVVVSDFSLAAMRHLDASPAGEFSLEKYASWDYGSLLPPRDSPSESKQIFELLRGHRITRSGDLSIAVGILTTARLDRRIVIRHARDVSARELRSGSHIILGNPNSTPWAEPYEAKLHFQWMRGKGYRDTHPGAGEAGEYYSALPSFDERGRGYGRLACLPNISGQGSVLLISGINMVTMEATGEAGLAANTWKELKAKLGLPKDANLPPFEAILRTEALDNTPQHAQIVKARLIR